MTTLTEEILPEKKKLNIPVTIKGKDDAQDDWTEQSNLISISNTTISFSLSRKCQVGRLLRLEFSAKAARSVQFNLGENRSVWGVVQHSTLVTDDKLKTSYHVGVALIGHKTPVSYNFNPLQYYRFCGISKDGFWKIEESAKEFIIRKYPRYLVEMEVYLGTLDNSFNPAGGEKVFTDNISFGGAAVFSTLELKIDDCVKFISVKYEFIALAVVRNIQVVGGLKKIHLEFVAGRFPLEKVDF